PLVVMWKEWADRRRGERRAAVVAAQGKSSSSKAVGASQQSAQPQRKIQPKAKRPVQAAPPRYRRKRPQDAESGPNGSSVGILTGSDSAADADIGDDAPDQG
ncbi:MAG TPA: hypothetical protein VEJ20_05155, partial [Candidatus Eremiobacteraceae bacterium]|nr:hypothetical protein [Candidatus Eremiobacteraceae bacterium]